MSPQPKPSTHHKLKELSSSPSKGHPRELTAGTTFTGEFQAGAGMSVVRLSMHTAVRTAKTKTRMEPTTSSNRAEGKMEAGARPTVNGICLSHSERQDSQGDLLK